MRQTYTTGKGAATRPLSIAITLLLTSAALAPVGFADHSTITAVIDAPVDGATVSRIDAVQFVGKGDKTHGNHCTGGVGLAWDLGDGNTSTGPSPTHTYAALGTYTVTLTATAACGSDTDVLSLTVVNLAPTAALEAPSLVTAGDVLVADASGSTDADGTVVGYRFVLDGVEQPVQDTPTLELSFTKAGDHAIAVQVLDNDGATSTTQAVAVSVEAGPLAAITVSGADGVVAGSTATYAAAGADAYGNPVPLETTTVEHTAGTVAGETEEVCHTEAGVTGCKTITVVADALATITVGGPDEVQAGRPATFGLSGADQYGNAVLLARTTLDHTVGTAAGTTEEVCYTELDVTGCKTITVVPDDLATIALAPGAATLNVGQGLAFAAAGADQYGNAVAIEPAWGASLGAIDAHGAYTATEAGPATVTAAVGGIVGIAHVLVLDSLDVSLAMEEDAYHVNGALLGGVRGNVTVAFDSDGTHAPGTNVTVVLTRLSPLGELDSVTIEGTTDADGRFAFEAPATFALPGPYRVDVFATLAGNAGETSGAYTVAV